jgi:DNA-binding PadR family transcriptional regulator
MEQKNSKPMLQQRRIIAELNEKIIKSFLDLIVLAELQIQQLDGYTIIKLIHTRHHLLLSSGTVYSLLYSLERHELIQGEWKERKRIYSLTEKGKQNIETILSSNNPIKELVKSILKTTT